MVPAPTAEDERRPGTILFVYVWDMILAVLSLFVAVAAFGGGVEVHGRVVSVALPAQILQALGSACFAALLVALGALLTRRHAWVRRAQIVALTMAVVIGLLSFVVDQVSAGGGLDVLPLLGTLLLALVDGVAITAMTGSRMAAWYREPGAVPMWVGGLVAFWAAASVAFVGLRLAG